MYTPGLTIKAAMLAIWSRARGNKFVLSGLKGVECGAVGLVFTAVYRLWILGIMDSTNMRGTAIDTDPWFVLITVMSFSSSKWFGVKPPIAILSGGLLGMLWFGVTQPDSVSS
jgi:chromate transport protein ChrA